MFLLKLFVEWNWSTANINHTQSEPVYEKQFTEDLGGIKNI